MKRLILALILLVVVLITGCADAGRRDQDKKSVHGPAVTLGIERIGEYEQLFAGKRVGLITNQTGVDSKLRSSEDILLAHTDLTGIFVPEHGLFGAVAAGDDVDGAEYKGVKVYSLYGAARRPTPAMLDAIDVMTVDIQEWVPGIILMFQLWPMLWKNVLKPVKSLLFSTVPTRLGD